MQTPTPRSELPDLPFRRYRSRQKLVDAIQLQDQGRLDSAFASGEGFAWEAGDWKVIYGRRADGSEDSAIVAREIFEQTYEQVEAGRYRKKKSVIVEAAQLDAALDIVTLEGPSHGKPGDWLLLGVEGEPYFNSDEYFRDRYDSVDAD